MAEEQGQKILEQLAELGFQGTRLEQSVLRNIKMNLPGFVVSHRIAYGKETMFYDLSIEKDAEGLYTLTGFNAIHRGEIYVHHHREDTTYLEQRMAAVNWDGFFEGQLPADTLPPIHEILDQLAQLGTGGDPDALLVQGELMYKYWPRTAMQHAHKNNLQYTYEHQREFPGIDGKVVNAHLAYHILSGRMDDLYEKVRACLPASSSGMHIESLLERELSRNPENFELKYHFNSLEAYTEVVLPVSKIEDWYSLDAYHLTMTAYPHVEHGIYNDVDSRVLEEAMREINWHKDRELFIFHEDEEPEFLPKAASVHQQFNRLSEDSNGKGIADVLALKYWQDVTFFGDMIPESAWERLEDLPKKVHEFGAEVKVAVATKLLAGKAVPEHLALPFLQESATWVRLNQQKDPPYDFIQGQSREALERTLRMLPILSADNRKLAGALYQGDKVQVQMINNVTVVLEANPEQKTINVYSLKDEPIYTNLAMDPAWRPPSLAMQKAVNRPHKKTEFSKPPGKGKGLK